MNHFPRPTLPPRRRTAMIAAAAAALLAAGLQAAPAQAAQSILFIGNSFTYGQGSAVHYYRAGTVTDLNDEGIGGLPALFKSFTTEAGLNFDVYLETQGGVGLDWHLEHKSADYLITEENTNEIIGDMPMVAPPTIGG